jgi:DNA-binding beta-propeller fold protein YncE
MRFSPLQSQGLDIFLGIDNTGIDVIATISSTSLTVPPTTSLCPQQQIVLATNTPPLPIHIDLQRGTFHPLSFFLSPDATKAYVVTSDQGVLAYSFSTQTTSAIPLSGNAVPLAADMTVDGTLLYVAGSDGLLHELNTLLALDQMDVQFLQLSDSSNNFCYSSYSCALNLVAIKP